EEAIGEIESREFLSHIKSKIKKGTIKFVVDLSRVRWISSTGLGVLVASLNAAKEKGGDLVLVGAADNVQNLLTITQLLHFFKSSDSIEEAVANFSE
ncbi:STAS domain-containing protein, partial [candidate division KSB1 bacterium]